jgi:hypothetical protein
VFYYKGALKVFFCEEWVDHDVLADLFGVGGHWQGIYHGCRLRRTQVEAERDLMVCAMKGELR